MSDLKELKERKQQKVRELRDVADQKEEIRDKIDSADDVSDETRDELDSLRDKSKNLRSEVKGLEEDIKEREFLSGSDDEPIKPSPSEPEENRERRREVSGQDHYHHAFHQYCLKGLERMDREDMKKLEQGRQVFDEDEMETRATQVSNVDDLGGFTVPRPMMESVQSARKRTGGMRRAGTDIITTDGGGTLPFPTSDDTANKGEYLGEDTQTNEQEVSFSETNLEAFLLSSKSVPVSRVLLQDSAVDMDEFLGERFGRRMARRENEAFTTGSGSSEPQGIVPDSAEGTTSGSSGSINEDDLLDLKHSVDEAYRDNAQYMMNDSVFNEIKQIKNNDGDPIFLNNYRNGEQPQIDGDEIVINNDMVSTITTNDKSVLYGNFRWYKIRDVRDVTVLRESATQMRSYNIVFVAFARNDGKYINPGNDPIKHLKVS